MTNQLLIETFFDDPKEAQMIFLIRGTVWGNKARLCEGEIKNCFDYIVGIDDNDTKIFQRKILEHSPLIEQYNSANSHVRRLRRLYRTADAMIHKKKPARKDNIDIEQAKRVSIKNVIGEAPHRGGFYVCPFHKEKGGSFKIYEDTNSFYCFGCGKGGDVIKYVMLKYDYSFIEAVEYLNDFR